tara:strand:- start:24086 stop:24517 length:432 start_codon:yes stop_codon:yes gene_type:complete
MSGVLRFQTREQMDRMACVLMGKGKEITVIEPGAYGNAEFALRVNPPVRWSTEHNYDKMIDEYMEGANLKHDVGANPREYTPQRIRQFIDVYWVCDCDKIRPIAADRCFACNWNYPEQYNNPTDDAMRAHLVAKWEAEQNASG